MTSLVVHFCSAPLACFVDALDTAGVSYPRVYYGLTEEEVTPIERSLGLIHATDED